MVKDAIAGARYNDEMFGSEFTITEIYSESGAEVADETEVFVVMDYEMFDNNITVSLDSFRDNTQIAVIELPFE